jgi:methylphosphotriester-DNA--protein-cysteine methyltransferase
MRCPVCKADNNEAPQCRRCKADLSLLLALARRRTRLMAEAVALLARGDAARALEAALAAGALRSDDESHGLAALTRVMGHDFQAAWDWYRCRLARRGSGSSSVD